MDLNGTVVTILPEQRFNGKNGEVVKNQFVIEHGGQYKKKAVFGVLGEDRWKQMNVMKGADVQVSFDVDAREWQSKWFGELTAWRVQVLNGSQQQVQQPQRQTQASQTQIPQDGSHVDDSNLPF